MAKKPSNHQARQLVEKSQSLFDSSAIVLSPGDQVRISIPADPGETNSIWAYVLRTKAPDGKISVVVDEVIVINKDAKYHPQKCVFADISQVTGHIPVDKSGPVVSITLIEGSVIELKRIDGKTAPIHVMINNDSESEIWSVGHSSANRVK